MLLSFTILSNKNFLCKVIRWGELIPTIVYYFWGKSSLNNLLSALNCSPFVLFVHISKYSMSPKDHRALKGCGYSINHFHTSIHFNCQDCLWYNSFINLKIHSIITCVCKAFFVCTYIRPRWKFVFLLTANFLFMEDALSHRSFFVYRFKASKFQFGKSPCESCRQTGNNSLFQRNLIFFGPQIKWRWAKRSFFLGSLVEKVKLFMSKKTVNKKWRKACLHICT